MNVHSLVILFFIFFYFCQVIINNCSCNSGQSSKDKSSSSMTWKKNNSSFSCEKTKLYILLQNLKKVLRQEHRRQSDRWMESETKYSRTMRAISSSNSRLLRTTENACWRGDKGWPIQLSRISNIHRTSVTSSNNLIQVEPWWQKYFLLNLFLLNLGQGEGYTQDRSPVYRRVLHFYFI